MKISFNPFLFTPACLCYTFAPFTVEFRLKVTILLSAIPVFRFVSEVKVQNKNERKSVVYKPGLHVLQIHKLPTQNPINQ